MTTTATTTDQTIKCPDWCTTNHEVDPDGGHDGPSWPDIPSLVPEYVVSIAASQYENGAMVVGLGARAESVYLTPDQAREAGLALLSAASWVKDHQVSA